MPADLVAWLQALAAWRVAAFFRDSTAAYATLNALHILSIGLVIGSIATLDLRVLGLFRGIRFGSLARPLSRMAATGVIFAATTGFLLFSVRPLTYVMNVAFLTKITLVTLGVLNALVLRSRRHWRDALDDAPMPDAVRASAFFSLMIWTGAVFAGRWIGFLQ